MTLYNGWILVVKYYPSSSATINIGYANSLILNLRIIITLLHMLYQEMAVLNNDYKDHVYTSTIAKKCQHGVVA